MILFKFRMEDVATARELFNPDDFYPRATRCGGDIVTLPWFRQCVRQSVRASRLILVNTIATKLLFTSSSNLAHMFTMMRG